MQHPRLVSILIPVHNCRSWVARAIDSALSQTRPATEILVLDDGSTDGSLDVIARYRPHIQVESCALGGQNRSRNRLTACSRGDWLIYLDADDELAPDAAEAMLEHCSDADAVYGTMESATFDGVKKVRSFVQVARDDDPWVAAFEWRLPNTSAFMFRRSALTRVGQWDESVQVCTDYDLYFRLLLAGATLKAAPNAMSLYRHWSVAQAVHVNPLSRVSTRLRLLNRAAEALATTDRMTERRRQAFEQSALKCIRSLYHFDRERAQDAFNKLLAWNDQVAPLSSEFARLYVLAFRLGGLDVAETIATWGRRVRKAVAFQGTSRIDFDAHAQTIGPGRHPQQGTRDLRA